MAFRFRVNGSQVRSLSSKTDSMELNHGIRRIPRIPAKCDLAGSSQPPSLAPGARMTVIIMISILNIIIISIMSFVIKYLYFAFGTYMSVARCNAFHTLPHGISVKYKPRLHPSQLLC